MRAAGLAASRRGAGGFSILELVVALAIAAILATYAVPSYLGYLARGHRIQAAAALHRAALYIEANAIADVITLPSGFDQSPQYGVAVYRLRVVPGDEANSGYAVEASPVDTGPMRDDSCGTFILDAAGVRSNRTAASGKAPEQAACWLAR
jgi:type IV pilus assembly protein PilE